MSHGTPSLLSSFLIIEYQNTHGQYLRTHVYCVLFYVCTRIHKNEEFGTWQLIVKYWTERYNQCIKLRRKFMMKIIFSFNNVYPSKLTISLVYINVGDTKIQHFYSCVIGNLPWHFNWPIDSDISCYLFPSLNNRKVIKLSAYFVTFVTSDCNWF